MSKADKRKLLLSAATVMLWATPAQASSVTVDVVTEDVCVENVTCITDKTTTAKTTTEKNNIYVFYDDDNGYGKIIFKKENTAIVTIDSDNYVYSNGYMSNSSSGGAVGIKIDMTSSHDMTGIRAVKTSGEDDDDDGYYDIVYDDEGHIEYEDYEFLNYDEEEITNAALYLDEDAVIYLTGKGDDKVGIWLDADGTTGNVLTGNIITQYGSTITIKGDDSYGLLVDEGVTLEGNIELGGAITLYQHKSKSMATSNLYGVYIGGYIDGNVSIVDNGSVTVAGQGAQGIFITGSGVSGNVMIEGSVLTEGATSSSSYYYYKKKKKYSEGGTAITINTSIGKGFEITGANYDDDSDSTSGSISVIGSGTAILISPVVESFGTTYTADSSIVIDLYQYYDDEDYDGEGDYTYEQYDPGFAIYNRGSISIYPANKNESVTAALEIEGTEDLPTYIDGGIFNSGSISATAYTKHKKNYVTSTAVLIEGNVYVGGYYDSDTDTYYSDSITCDEDDCTYTADSAGIIDELLAAEDESYARSGASTAAFVNSGDTGSGSIVATVSGKGGGTATAILISAESQLNSIYNSGTISAVVSTSKTSTTQTVAAYAIQDLSGTLTYIYNSGTISASATSLDSDEQIAWAIDLSADDEDSDAYDGVTIVNESTGDSATAISGDIVFGSGTNQKIYIVGAGSSYTASITGDVYYGSCGGSDDCGDLLSIGAYGYFYGGIYAKDNVSLTVYNNGLLYIENDADDCLDGYHCYVSASDLTVYNGGYLSIGVSQNSDLYENTDDLGDGSYAIIQSTGDVYIEEGASLSIIYNSYLSTGSYSLVSTSGTMTIEDMAEYSHDISTPMTSQCEGSDTCGAMPFLFSSQSLEIVYYDSDGNEVDSADGASTSVLELSVTTKDADELQLTGYAKKIFSYANEALQNDDDLGAAMINGIHADSDDLTGTAASEEAQRAYDSFAPNVTGGTRAIAVSLTDQATGVVGARQRSLRMFAKEEGDLTLWTQEFVQQIKNPGQGAYQEDGSRGKTGFKDHGFGVVLGLDAGSPSTGWLGGALTYFSGDINEIGRSSHENQTWVMATGYGTWRGRGWFLDAKVDAAYAHIKGLRYIYLNTTSGYVRYAQNAHSALMLSGGISGGTSYTYGAFTFQPQASLDAMVMRENGYAEYNPVDSSPDYDGFNLKVRSYYAKSLRLYLGNNVRYDLDLGDRLYLQPELRAGYRYDFLSDPQTVTAAFKDLEPDTSGNQSGDYFSLTGPRPAAGSFVLGSSLGLTSGAWSLNLNYDFVRGTNMNIEQVATFNLIGRI